MIPADPVFQITPPIEDYLKAIYTLSREGGAERVSTSLVATRMDVSAASATNMMQKLAEMKLVEYVPYHGVSLTAAGEKIALEIIRHHRLIELYLAEALGYTWDAVHDEAERLEHVISEEFEDRIDAMLGHPTIDPHGDPIPPKTGLMPVDVYRSLNEVGIGESVVIQRVYDRDGELLRHLASLEIFPGVRVKLLERDARGGQITLERDSATIRLDPALAERVFVH